MSRQSEHERSFQSRCWMTMYVVFVLRSLLTRQLMPADATVAAWIGVRRESIVRGRRRPGFFTWLQTELQSLLRAELLDPALVAASEVPVLAGDIERTRRLCAAHRVRLQRARIKLGHRWLEVSPAPPPADPQTARRPVPTRARPARPATKAA